MPHSTQNPTAQSYVNRPRARRFGLRERLLLGLLVAALGTVLVAAVGWLSFQRVVGSQQAIVRETLPAADALHEAVRANARLAALAPRLVRADSAAELEQLRAALGADVPLVRDRLAALRSPHVEAELRTRLQTTGDQLATGLAEAQRYTTTLDGRQLVIESPDLRLTFAPAGE